MWLLFEFYLSTDIDNISLCPALFFSGSFECQPEAVKVKPSFSLVHFHITLYHSTFRVRLWECNEVLH